MPKSGWDSLVATLASAATPAVSTASRIRRLSVLAMRLRHTHSAIPSPKGMTRESVTSSGDPEVPPETMDRPRIIRSCTGPKVLNAAYRSGNAA